MKQYFVDFSNDYDNAVTLVTKLKQDGYKIPKGYSRSQDVNEFLECLELKIVVIDIADMELLGTNVTCMACYCSHGGCPVKVNDFLLNYDEFIKNYNEELYLKLVKESYILKYSHK